MKKWFKGFRECPFTLTKRGKKKLTYLAMWHRMIALALVCCMAFTLLPATALATEEKPAVESEAEQGKEEPVTEEPVKEEPVTEEPVTEEPVKKELASQVTSLAVTDAPWEIGKNNAADVKAVLSADQTTLTISGTGEMKRWDTSRESPWATARETITTVTIGEGVTNVGGSAFDMCSQLNAITLPASLTTIERLAFYECKELASISIPNRVTTIEDSAFYSCEKLDNITIPEGMTAIQSSTFRCCKALTSITIPEGVTSIEGSAFNGCSKLGTVTMNFSKDKKSKIIGWGVFRHIKTKLVIQVKVKSDDAKTFVGWSSTLLNPGKDTAAATFTDAKQATTTLTNVPSDCSITAEYGAPPTETSWDIGKNNASDVKAVLSADKTTLAISGTGEMKRWANSTDAPWNAAIATITTVTIGEGVTNIGEMAFYNCSRLNDITLPTTLTTIESLAFYGCGELASITIPEGVTTIEDRAFYNCVKLASITIPEGMTDIQNSTFRCCEALTSITIPEGVTNIEASAFNGCSKLGTVTMNFSNDKKSKIIGSGVFQWTDDNLVIQVKAKSDDAKTFVGWSSTLLKAGDGTVAAFDNATEADTTLTNKPEACTITAEYMKEAEWTLTDGTIASGTFANALTAMEASGGSIQLLSEITTGSDTTFPATTIDLDLNGQSWTSGGEITVLSGGTLTITDSKGIGTVTATTTNCVTVADGGILAVQSGNITASGIGFNGIDNSGTLKLSGGTITSDTGSAITNQPTGILYLSDAPSICSPVDYAGIDSLEGAQVIANNGETDSGYVYFTGTIVLAIPGTSVADYVVVSGLKDADHTKLFTVNAVPEGLITVYDDTAKTLKLAEVPTVTSVEVTPVTASVEQNQTQQFGVEVKGANSPAQTVTWKVTGAEKKETSINGEGLLAVAADETAKNLTVVATSTLDETQTGTASVMVTKKRTSVTEEMIQTIDAQKYTGSALEPTFTVQDGKKILTVGTDYTVTYDNNKNAGTATATISGAGAYTGTASKTFTINKADGTAVNGYAVPGTLEAITNITPMLSNIALDGKGDGTWSWAADQALTADNANAEQTFQATFTPTDSVNYEVVETGVKVAVSTISLAKNQVYRLTKGDVKTVEQLVTIVGATLKEGTDYKIKLTADKDNIVVVKDNEIQAKNVGVVRVLMDILIGTKKAVSEPLIVEVKSEQGGQSNNVAEEIKDLLNEVNQNSNTPGEIVNAIADATIRMNQKEKEKLSNETLKTLDELFQKANPNLVVKTPIIEQMGNTENQITQANISGIALAVGLTSDQIKNGSTVQLKIEQEVPFKVADSKKAQMQLKLTLLVNGQKTQLASPVIIDIQLDKNMETQGLEIMHQHDDGKIDLLTEGKELTTKTFVINRNTSVLTMQVASFSTFTFTTNKVQVEAEKPLIPLKPLNPGDGKTYKASAVPTGDDTPIGAIMVMVLLGVVGMAGVIWTKKKNR